MTPCVPGSRSHARNAVARRKKRSGASAGILIDSNFCQMTQRGISSVAEEFFVCKFYSARFLVRTLFFKQAVPCLLYIFSLLAKKLTRVRA